MSGMRPAADPSELRRLARRCRDEASHLESAISDLSRQVSSTSATWTGTAAESLRAALQDEMGKTRRAKELLLEAATEFDRGAGQVEDYLAEMRRRQNSGGGGGGGAW